ncbi:hypothetical protein IFM89_018246 [Coptis chinensis]|uniref:Peptidase S54 rhomboid domain-containing protein n=1 Tax=Coptis chinensis TaxID=261450 RepID=A0A835IAQ1_9MAGN|nr:hypothetical protein IFM89_018246 [Coptis chinensis]
MGRHLPDHLDKEPMDMGFGAIVMNRKKLEGASAVLGFLSRLAMRPLITLKVKYKKMQPNATWKGTEAERAIRNLYVIIASRRPESKMIPLFALISRVKKLDHRERSETGLRCRGASPEEIELIIVESSSIKRAYVAQLASHGKLVLWGAKINSLIDKGQVWRLATSFFLHANVGHLMVNCYSLNSVGPTMENIGGPRRFLLDVFSSAIATTRSSSYSDPVVSRVQVAQQVIGFAKHLQLVLQGPFLEWGSFSVALMSFDNYLKYVERKLRNNRGTWLVLRNFSKDRGWKTTKVCTGAKSEQQSKLAARKEVLLRATLLRPLMMLGKLPHTYGTTSWVQFFSNLPCQYASGSITNLEDAWKQWTTSITGAQIFLGLPAAPRATGSGFIPVNNLTSEVLPCYQRVKQVWRHRGDLFSEVLQPHRDLTSRTYMMRPCSRLKRPSKDHL